MLRTLRIAQLTVRLSGLALIILGILLWLGYDSLRAAHMGLGLLFVLAIWSLAALGFKTRANVGLAVRAAVWGIVVLWLGMVQTRIWPGGSHVYVRALHLLVGLIAIGVAEALAARIKRARGGPPRAAGAS
jgi:hypothetical protein